MKSTLPKVLHPLLGKPMLGYVLETAKGLRPAKTLIVIGHQAGRVADAFPAWAGSFIHQVPQLGTGHALQVTRPALESFQGTVMVLSGDVPLIESDTLKQLFRIHNRSKAVLTLISTEVTEPKGYGRIIRDAQGNLQKIVEEKDATPQERLLREINAGLYCFESDFLFSALSRLTRKNQQKEYYLTDLVQIARETGQPMAAYFHPRSEEILGINDRAELARSGHTLEQQILGEWMVKGVTIIDPTTTQIEKSVRIGPDTVIDPFTVIKGKTRIGSHCHIQSHVVIDSHRIKDGTVVPPFTYLPRESKP
jgi:bifunctional UDP-N-acetylglucosamine pyrophosphorylase/glucosamine-1-phosphate N-acetyltransferase